MIKLYSYQETKSLLEKFYKKYHHPSFITNDPIQVPHQFTQKEDIEIAGFFATLMAWGNRKQTIKNAKFLMELMNHKPYEFILNINKKDLHDFKLFKHRTIHSSDIIQLIWVLHKIYTELGGLETLFTETYLKTNDLFYSLENFHKTVALYTSDPHCLKHISNVGKKSATKRLNLFIRWMVRSDNNIVDFGLWKSIPASALYIPLDVHVSETARKLELLTRKQNDWKAVIELTENLRQFDRDDPVKYDYALFGLGLEKHL